MHAIPRPRLDDRANLADIINRRLEPARTRLRRLEAQVVGAYDAYDSIWSTVGHASIVDDRDFDAKADLKGNYILASDRKLLHDEVLALARNGECPMCGYAQAASLDHYLPKSLYPEYSIFSVNLVPACPTCNLIKGNLCSQHPDERFLHPYYDKPPDEVLLFAEIYVADKVAVNYRVASTATNEQVLRRYAFHLEKLGLLTTYRRAANVELYDRAITFQELHAAGGRELVARSLQREARGLAQRRGCNDWKTALYQALSMHEPFLDYGCLQL